jgi:uncharacterized phiE125 gp8 family phage protein
MNSILIDGPAVEPVTLSDMKAYLRVDDDDDRQDELIAGLTKAARLMVEATSRRILVEQRWGVMLDRWPREQAISLPLSPLMAVERIKVFDRDGASTILTGDAFEADLMSDPPCIAVRDALPPGRARNGIMIEVRAGYGAAPDAVPAPLKLAIRILVAHWFEKRGDVAGEQMLPPEALALVAPFQRARL